MAALALSPGPVLDDLPDGLTRICRERGLPLLTVPSPTPFLKIARAYWGLLARSGQERLTASLGAHRALVRAAAGPDPVRVTVHRLAGAIDGWAALLSAEGDVRAVWPQAQEPQARQAATEIGRLRVAGPHSSATFPLGVDDAAWCSRTPSRRTHSNSLA